MDKFPYSQNKKDLEHHLGYINQCLEMAEQNVEENGGPFAAIIVKDNKIIALSGNRVTEKNDPTAHAEILAIRKACESLNTFNLSGCSIYTSTYPCPMCFGAIYWAHLDAVYYAATKFDAANAGFDDDFIYKELENSQNKRIPFFQVKSGHSLKPFNKWKNKTDKQAY